MNKSNQRMLLIVMLLLVVPLRAATLSVVYPKVKANNMKLIDEIIDGVEDEFDGTLKLVSVPKKYKVKSIVTEVNNQKPDMVITLSKRGLKVARSLKGKMPLVSGFFSIKPKGVSGISNAADPQVLFTHLKQLAPAVTRINVVYSPRNQWLIELAKITAQKLGLKLLVYPVKDTKSAIQQYISLIEMIKKANNEKAKEKDALWLPHDSISVNDKVVLPMLLEAAWEHRFVIFSSKPQHAQRGTLFSLLPDNRALGVNLVKMVNAIHQNAANPGIQPTSEVKLAVNLKTASHLGLEYTTKQKGLFDLTFGTK